MNWMINKWKQHSLGISIILLIPLIISVGMLFQEKKEENRTYEHFLNRFYLHIDSSIDILDRILDKEVNNEDSDLISLLHDLSLELMSAHKTLQYGDLFLIIDTGYHDDYLLTDGVWVANETFKKGLLSPDDKRYLITLRTALMKVKNQMYSEDTGQEDPNLSKQDFKKIIVELQEMR